MKTTVDIADALAADARELAKREGTTLRALLEAGLRREIEDRKLRQPFRLRDASLGKGGLRPELEGADWSTIRGLIYEGRGG